MPARAGMITGLTARGNNMRQHGLDLPTHIPTIPGIFADGGMGWVLISVMWRILLIIQKGVFIGALVKGRGVPTDIPHDLHYNTWIGDRTLDFLGKQDPDQPFFLWWNIIIIF